ncbi:MAG TPA: PAS domain S-box protein [Verrucomicrobiae bacterium]
MSQPLRVLIVEDSTNDAELLSLELERSGYDVVCQRVQTRDTMATALAREAWDLIIADYVMPQFTGLEALGLVKAQGLDLPFIIVSGHINESTAVAAMKAGAHDYVMKDNLARLGSAVQRELREAESRRDRRRADEILKIEQVFRQAIENSVPSGITAIDLDGRQTYVNPAFCEMVGWSEAELLGARPPFRYWPPEQIDPITDALARFSLGGGPASGLELRFRRRDEERIDVLLQATPLKDPFGAVTGWVSSVSDITERKRAERLLTAEHGITRILTNARNLDDAAPGIIQVLLGSLEVDFGILWVPEPGHALLRPAFLQAASGSPALQSFLDANHEVSFAPGIGLPGRAWRDHSPQWAADLASEPDSHRREAASRAGLRSALAFPVHSAQDSFAVFEFYATRSLSLDSPLINMMTAIGHEIGLFLHRRDAEDALRRAHEDLETRVQQRTAELKAANTKLRDAIDERRRLENELLEITDQERRRIGLDLHDDLGQRLSGIALMTKGLELKLAKAHVEEAHDAARIHSLIQGAMSHASDLAHDLATLDLGETDLPSALRDLAAHTRDLFGIACRFKLEGEIPPVGPPIGTQLYKIVQEAVTNAIKHGKTKRVAITLRRVTDGLALTVASSGLPFPDLRGKSTGMGLRIMKYRASLVGGSLTVQAAGPRGGALVTCLVPVEP